MPLVNIRVKCTLISYSFYLTTKTRAEQTSPLTPNNIMNVLLIISLILIITLLLLIVKNNKTPTNLGVINGLLACIPKTPNAVSSQTTEKDKKVEPFPFKHGLQESKYSIKEVLDIYDGIEIFEEDKNYIYAVSTTSKMRFHDDIEFFFDERTKVVHFRSASRVGYFDMGLNRKRYNLLRKEYKAMT